MRIEQFEAIIATAKYQSMQRAAESLYTTAQNISKLIKDFEKEFHITVFVRNRHGVFPTEEGRYIVDELTKAMQILTDLQKQYIPQEPDENLMSDSIEQLRVLSAPSESEFASSLLGYMNNRYPLKRALLDIKDPVVINWQLNHAVTDILKNYDIIFTNILDNSFNFLKKNCPDAGLFHLYKNTLGVHLNRANPLAQKNNISVKELYDQSLVAFIPDEQTSTLPLRALSNIGCNLEPRYVIKSQQACMRMIEKNIGYSVIGYNESAPQIVPDNTLILPLKEKVFIYHVMIVNPAVMNEFFFSRIQNFVGKNFKYVQQVSK